MSGAIAEPSFSTLTLTPRAVAGITLQPSCPYTRQQNNVAARTNRTLKEYVKAMLFKANTSQSLWAEVLM
jgi:hypothetical protein